MPQYRILSQFYISTLGDLADVLQQVVRLNDEIRPHLERYQELLRSGNNRQVSDINLLSNKTIILMFIILTISLF